MRSRPSLIFTLGLLVAAASITIPALISDRSSSATSAVSGRFQPDIDIQEEGPLMAGIKISSEQAKRRSPYELPVPPTNDQTGSRSGIWIDVGKQIAFVWDTYLRFYVSDTEVTQEQAEKEWAEIAATEPDTPWVITTARGETAIGAEGSGARPSSLTFIEQGLTIQFVSPAHTLEELRQFAEAIQYEQ